MSQKKGKMAAQPVKDGPARRSKGGGPGFLWIFGVNPVLECLRQEKIDADQLWIARRDAKAEHAAQMAQRLHIALHRVERKQLTDKLGTHHHQGLALRCREFAYADLHHILKKRSLAWNLLLFLDSIKDPGNVGSILRSAAFFGARGVVLTKDRCAPVTSTVVKIACGATAHIPVAREINLVRAIESAQRSGYWIVGLDASGTDELHELDLTPPIGLVVGSEETGMRRLVRESCDFIARIPGHGALESLNAAVAAAVAMGEIARQHWQASRPPARP